jgi:hypothetical protein
MTIARNFTNPEGVTDYTGELLLIPNKWTMIGDDGVFTKDFLATSNVTFEHTEQGMALVSDKPWGERSVFSGGETKKTYNFLIPHFPLDDTIKASDLTPYTASGDAAGKQEALVKVRSKKMAVIRRSFEATQEYARCQALQGLIYAPNSTVPYTSWFAEFGVAQTTVDFDMVSAPTTDIISKCEAVISSIQDNAYTGAVISEVVGYCSPSFFAALISHPKVTDAYQGYMNTPNPNKDRLGSGIGRTFFFGGITFKEYRGAHDGNAYIPAGEAYFVPMGESDMFMEYYAPAQRFDTNGSLAAEAYMWEYAPHKGRSIDIESESNFLCMLRRPKMSIKATTT